VGLFAAFFAERVALADVNRNGAAQIWEREGGLPVASVGRTEEAKERLVLVDGQKLAIA
jgi:hypothetical protein